MVAALGLLNVLLDGLLRFVQKSLIYKVGTELLQLRNGILLAFLFVGKFATKSAGLPLFVQIWVLTCAGACKPAIFFGPNLYGYTSKGKSQETNGQ